MMFPVLFTPLADSWLIEVAVVLWCAVAVCWLITWIWSHFKP